jgi:hypothetical protein
MDSPMFEIASFLIPITFLAASVNTPLSFIGSPVLNLLEKVDLYRCRMSHSSIQP